MSYNRINMSKPINSRIRVFHASPNAPAVDVYTNGNLIVKDLAYTEISQYLPVPPGNYNIKVFPTGETKGAVVNTNLFVPGNSTITVAAIGTLPNISLYPVPEPSAPKNNGRPCVRFVHLSPNAPNVDIRLEDGTTVFGNVAYKGITNYTCVPEGSYTFDVVPTGTNNVVLTVPDVMLKSDTYYTIYALGLVGKNPPLEAVLITDAK